jgi:Arc/MetJ-type ribon-helix-helix transcriptional regulator
MTIHLPRDLETFVRDAVRIGRYAHEDDVIRDALTRLKQSMPEDAPMSNQHVKHARPAKQKKPLTEAELQQHMLRIGLMSQLPDTAADFDDPDDQLITIKGEPLSETIIRERR